MTERQAAVRAKELLGSGAGAEFMEYLKENHYNVIAYRPQNEPPFTTNDVLFYEGMRAMVEVLIDLVKRGNEPEDATPVRHGHMYI